MIEILLAQNMDTNARDNEGNTALDMAKIYGGKEVVELLMKHGTFSGET